ncbi:MAG: hypothetical protein KME43_21905 [Myxacorys chilensis ATA2-1-KO14]|jgi:hypothetical protein|nr:hypothetical protein [Myxacorys chilensis ATA2-1-KO14]
MCFILSLDRGNGGTKFVLGTEDKALVTDSFPSLLAPVEKEGSISVEGQSWIYGLDAWKAQRYVAIRKPLDSDTGKLENLKPVVASILHHAIVKRKVKGIPHDFPLIVIASHNIGSSAVASHYEQALGKFFDIQIEGSVYRVRIERVEVKKEGWGLTGMPYKAAIDWGFGTMLPIYRAPNGHGIGYAEQSQRGVNQALIDLVNDDSFADAVVNAGLPVPPTSFELNVAIRTGSLNIQGLELRSHLDRMLSKEWDNYLATAAYTVRKQAGLPQDEVIGGTGGGFSLISDIKGDAWLAERNIRVGKKPELASVGGMFTSAARAVGSK